ncbi:MAG: tetratricopeptide repeat protein [Candidatus Omnitrophica bacterium]|nr:tetratricopeptide repeat protein [Candidatus Omnitrophota bacterium]MDD5593067.1 tetratricopeptide repeat protein [Candidatus Omnitrophota bacterium]
MLDKKYTYLILAGLCFLVYANSLPNAFVSDDIPAILENPYIISMRNYWADPQGLLNSLSYRIAKFNVIPYHLISVILHFINTLLVFLFLRLFFKTDASLLAAALFAVHPLHTEAVSWISGRPYLILAFFVLTTYLLYHRATDPHMKDKNPAYVLYLSALAIFSYFIIGNISFYFLFPFLIMFSDIIFNRWKKNWRLWIPFFLIMVIRLALAKEVICARVSAVVLKTGWLETWRNPVFYFIYSIFSHLWLLIFPARLTFYHDPIILRPLVMLCGLIAIFIFLCLLPFIFKRAKIILFGAVIFILFLAPTYSPLPVAFVVAERYAYLPSIFLSIIAAFLYERYLKKAKGKQGIWIMVLFVFLISAYGLRTICRNKDWKDNANFWKTTLKTSPYSVRAHNSIGTVYLQEGDIEAAIKEFDTAIRLDPAYDLTYNNRAGAYFYKGELDKAISDYDNAIKINPVYAEAYNNRGMAYKNKNEPDKAISDYDNAIKINPVYAEVYYNRANAYVTKGNLTGAISDYDMAIKINPYAAQFYANRGAVYFLKQEYAKVRQDIHKAETLGYKFNPEFINKLKKEIGKNQ